MHNLNHRHEPPRDDAFERRLDDALAAPPTFVIPADFAARVASLTPARPPFRVPATHYGRNAIVLSAAALLVALLLLAPHTSTHSAFVTAIEWLLSAQLSAMGLFFVLPRGPLRSTF